jgi:hydroxypyruvate reductase
MPEANREAQFHQMREVVREIFRHALGEASISKAFARHVHCERGLLRVSEDIYDLHSYARVLVISLGKAGHTMVEALTEQVGASLEGIVASSVEPSAQVRGFRYFHGGHPTPNAESIRAASAMLRALDGQTASSLVIFLLSGGGSSIVEKPIDEEISLDDLIATYRALVLSGATIAEVNSIRKHLSAVKGGRLAQAAFPAQQISLLVSDVPDNSPDALASGPTMPDSTSVEDCYLIAEKYDLLRQFPQPTRELFERHALEETPKSNDPAFYRSRWWPILSNQTAIAEAKAAAQRAGFKVHVDNSCDDWDYERAAEYLLQSIRELKKDSERVCLISGGEVTVKVTNGGVGGRNQQFALTCAEKITSRC